jgi:sulfofructose kinase
MATVAAVTIARLGGQASIWTRIGDDATGRMFIDDLAHEGVDVADVRQLQGGRTWFSSILVDRDGERLVVPYVDQTLDRNPDWLPLKEVAHAGAVMCDMRWIEGAHAVFSQARKVGVPTILDADVAPVADLRALIPLADHVLFSESALASLIDIVAPEQALRKIAGELDAKVIGVTLGERGSVIWERVGGDAVVHHVPAMQVRAMDTLNAGDIWHGTYAYGLVNDWGLANTVRAASVAAAIKCETFGGRLGAPRMGQLLERLSQWDAVKAL